MQRIHRIASHGAEHPEPAMDRVREQRFFFPLGVFQTAEAVVDPLLDIDLPMSQGSCRLSRHD
jgi:hypothetical protein